MKTNKDITCDNYNAHPTPMIQFKLPVEEHEEVSINGTCHKDQHQQQNGKLKKNNDSCSTTLSSSSSPGGTSRDHHIGAPSTSPPSSESSFTGRNNLQLLRHKAIFVSLILLLGACAAGAFLAMGMTGAQQDQELLFLRRADILVGGIEGASNQYESFGLWIHENCRAVDFVSPNISMAERDHGCSREEFKELYEYILSEGVEFQSAQFMPNITNENRQEAEDEARAYYAEHYPHVNYRGVTGLELIPGGGGLTIAPRDEQPFYFPVHRVEPVEGNEAAIELDIYSSSIQRPTLEKAVSTWKPALTDRLKLVQDKDPNAYSVILHHPGVPTTTRNDTPKGLSLMVIRIIDLIRGASRVETTKVYVYDYCSPEEKEEEEEEGEEEGPDFLGGALLYSNNKSYETLPEVSRKELLENAPSGSFLVEKKIVIADRTWTIVVLQVEGTYKPDTTYVILGACFIGMATIFLAVWFYTSMQRVAKMNRMKMEADIEKAAFIVESARKQAIAERELNDFIAHEVRNPLASAIAALSFVSAAVQESPEMQNSVGVTVRDDMNIIEKSLQFINELLRNMLDMHRAASKQMKVKLSPADLLEDICIPTKNMIHFRGNKKIELLIDCPQNLIVETDRLRLKQITLNLTNNSLKFVESGFVRIRALVVNNSVRIQIEDSGPGIPLEKREKLFKKFQDSLDQLNQGTGIGLNLCKNLAELMEGDIWLNEDYDSGIPNCPGSCFVVDLKRPPLKDADKGQSHSHNDEADCGLQSNEVHALSSHVVSFHDVEAQHLAPASHKTPPAPERPPTSSSATTPAPLPKNLSVLFTDDDTMIRRLFSRSLMRVAPTWECDLAANGETALSMAMEKDYDLIFMDQYMASIQKQMLGTETVRALRSQGCTSIICGLSANDVEEQFLDHGADSFMFKPFKCKKDEMEKELRRVLSSGGRRLQWGESDNIPSGASSNLDDAEENDMENPPCCMNTKTGETVPTTHEETFSIGLIRPLESSTIQTIDAYREDRCSDEEQQNQSRLPPHSMLLKETMTGAVTTSDVSLEFQP